MIILTPLDGRSAEYAIEPSKSVGHCKSHEEYVVACEKWKDYWRRKSGVDPAGFEPATKPL